MAPEIIPISNKGSKVRLIKTMCVEKILKPFVQLVMLLDSF